MKNLLFLFIALLMLSGCSQQWKIGKCTQWGVCKTVKDSTHIIDSTYLIEVPYYLNADTAWIEALMECDSNNAVIISNYKQVNGKYIRLEQDIKSGKYTIYSYLPARHDTVQLPSKIRIEYRDKIQETQVNILTWGQRTMIIAGYVGCALFLLIVIYFAYRLYRKIKG